MSSGFEGHTCARCGKTGEMRGRVWRYGQTAYYCHESMDSCYMQSMEERWPELPEATDVAGPIETK